VNCSVEWGKLSHLESAVQNGTHEGHIVNGTEIPPPEEDADKYAKFKARRDRALVLLLNLLCCIFLGSQKIQLLCGRHCLINFRKRLGQINWNFGANSMHSISRKEGLYKGISKQ